MPSYCKGRFPSSVNDGCQNVLRDRFRAFQERECLDSFISFDLGEFIILFIEFRRNIDMESWVNFSSLGVFDSV